MPQSNVLSRIYQGQPVQPQPPAISTITTATTGGTGGLAASTQYNYAVSIVDANGNESTAGYEAFITTGTGTTNTISVSWPAVTGAASYRVYRRAATSGGGLTLVGSTSSLSFTDTGFASGAAAPTVNATGETTFWTCPSGTAALVKQVVVANATGQTANFSLSTVPSGSTGGSSNRLFQNLSVKAFDTVILDLFEPMNVGDFLSGQSSATGLTITIKAALVVTS